MAVFRKPKILGGPQFVNIQTPTGRRIAFTENGVQATLSSREIIPDIWEKKYDVIVFETRSVQTHRAAFVEKKDYQDEH